MGGRPVMGRVTSADLVRVAREFVGVKFRHAGRGHLGIDCVGLIIVPAWRLGLTSYDPPNYSPEFDREQLVETLESLCESVWKRAALGTPPFPWQALAAPGDVLLLDVRGHPAHLAYWTGDGTILEAHGKSGVIERGMDPVTWEAIRAIYRWRELLDE